MSREKKSYGLILKKTTEISKLNVGSVSSAFADSDDDGANQNVAENKKPSVSETRTKMQAKREHERALAEDPTIFDYDAIYDELQAKKNEKIAEVKSADKERKSKYAEQILESHKKRILMQQSREERKQQKERVAEAGEFDDKEKFVTSAYKDQLAEMEKFRQHEAIEARLDDLTAVGKQASGMWRGGLYRTLLNAISRTDEPSEIDKKNIKQELVDDEDVKCEDSIKKHEAKLSSLRRSSNQDEAFIEFGDRKIKSDNFNDTVDDPQSTQQISLKAGLNILGSKTKKPTKVEQLRRRFTPSPDRKNESVEESNDETYIRTRSRHSKFDFSSSKRSRSRDERKSNRKHYADEGQNKLGMPVDSDEKTKAEKQRLGKDGKEKTKNERLAIIKKLLAHRNGPAQIEEMKKRYLTRKADGTIPLPL